MSFPTTEQGLKDAGYFFAGHKKCKGCGAWIEWWQTPNKKYIPLDRKTLVPHHSTCPRVNTFRKDKQTPARKEAPTTNQNNLFD